MQDSNSSNRISYIDLAKGLCIFMVVQHHTDQCFGYEYSSPLQYVLASFRMPLYFILSGLFFKEYGGFKQFFIKKTNKLLVPFFFFYIIFSIFLPVFLSIIDNRFSWSHVFKCCYSWLGGTFFNRATWFLLCLFFTNIIFYLLRKFVSCYVKDKYNVLATVILSICLGVIGYLSFIFKIPNVLWIFTACSATPFFCFGYILRKYTRILYPNRWDKFNVLFILILSCAFVIPWNKGMMIAMISNHFSQSPIEVYLVGICGTMVILLFSKIVGKIPYISYIGRYSIIILLTHQVLLNIIRLYFLDIFLNMKYGYFVCLISVLVISSILIPVLKKYLPYFTAQKDLLKT